MTTTPTITTIAPWFGANRVSGAEVGRQLGRLDWCGVPFLGGACELMHIQTRSGVGNDLHRHLINLARVVRDPEACHYVVDGLNHVLFHEEEYRHAQRRCREKDVSPFLLGAEMKADDRPCVQWAIDYFICCWMGPGAKPGKNTEFSSYFASRWTASGGASVKRFRSAVESLLGWSKILERWEFRVVDAFAFLGECKDTEGHGLYCDPPWPDAGAEYKHAFGDNDHRRLARMLATFKNTRVVVRYGDHPLIRECYPESRWRWVERTTRDQANGKVREVLIVNGAEIPGGGA